MQIEGYIEFVNGIPVSKDCLGKEFKISICGDEGILLTPQIPENFSRDGSWALAAPKNGKIRYVDSFRWGCVNSYPDFVSQIDACKIFFNNVDQNSYEEIGASISSHLSKWNECLIDNISVLLQKDYRGPRRVITSSDYNRYGLFNEVAGPNERFKNNARSAINLRLEKGLIFEFDDFQNVLSDTSIDKVPLLPFYFLLDAERAKFDENFRKSILDSATSIELCFTNIIDQMLPNDKIARKCIWSKYKGLGAKRDLLKAYKVKLPVEPTIYQEHLEKIRNDVIHGGYIPSFNETRKALDIAKSTLYTLLPKKYEL